MRTVYCVHDPNRFLHLSTSELQNMYTVVSPWMAIAIPNKWLIVRGHDKPIHGTKDTIYFAGGLKRLLKTQHCLIETADNEGFCWCESVFIQTPQQDVVLFFRPTNCVKSHDKRPPRRSLGFGNLPKISPYFLNWFCKISYYQWVCTPLSLSTTDEFTANDHFFLSQQSYHKHHQQQHQEEEEEEVTGVTQLVKKKHDSIN